MIIHKISDTVDLIYTDDKSADFNSIITKLNYSSGGGNLKSNIAVSYSSPYSPPFYNKSITSTKLQKGSKVTYIVNNSITFHYRDASSLINELNYFGKNTVLKFKGKSLGEDLSKYKANSIKNKSGTVITFKESTYTNDDNKLNHRFMHYMKTDNGRMLIPVIKRYVNTLMLFKAKRHLLTGYINLDDYMDFIRKPSSGILDSFTEKDEDSDFVIKIGNNSPRVKLKASSVNEGNLVVNLLVDANIESNETEVKPIPYIIFNTKPIKLINTTLPYFISRQNNMPIFITPVILKSSDMLTKLKGGINLLKKSI